MRSLLFCHEVTSRISLWLFMSIEHTCVLPRYMYARERIASRYLYYKEIRNVTDKIIFKNFFTFQLHL